jgi:CcmD family protein
LLAVLAASLLAAPVWSAPAETEEGGESRATGISAAEERRLTHLFWAYNVIWILLGVYVVSLGVRLRTVRRELNRMEERLGSAGG